MTTHLRNCPFCDTPPAYGIDSFSLVPYIRCENERCSVRPYVSDENIYGTVDQCVKKLAGRWNAEKVPNAPGKPTAANEPNKGNEC